MKCFAAVLLLALFAVAFAAEKPADVEKIEPANAEAENAARDKRGLLLGAAYTAPVAYTGYSPYVAPVAYSASYSVPYAYSAYRSYPYYYGSPYVYG